MEASKKPKGMKAFLDLARKVVAVPKSEIERAERRRKKAKRKRVK